MWPAAEPPGGKVAQQRPRHAVVQVLGKLQRALDVVGADPCAIAAAGAIEPDLARLGKRRPALEQPVGEQAKHTILGKRDCLLVVRAVLEAEDELALHTLAVRGLHELAVGQLVAVLGAQDEESMCCSLGKTDRDRLGVLTRAEGQDDEREK